MTQSAWSVGRVLSFWSWLCYLSPVWCWTSDWLSMCHHILFYHVECWYPGIVLMWGLNHCLKVIQHISSVQFNFSVMSDSLWPDGLQHTRPPCPSLTPRAGSNSCPSSWWCHPTISFSVVPFSSYLQSFPASGSFPVSHFFASGGQSIGVSASSVLPMNIQDWFPLGLTGLLSLL